MQEPAPPTPDAPAIDLARWAASLPPPPFVDPAAEPGKSRFVPLSPRVAVLILAAIVIGLLFWMARDSIRPFVIGLLFVYLLDPPVRWLVRRGLRRSLAILIVYVVAIAAVIAFLALTLTPLVNEILRFIADFPKLAADLDAQLQKLGDFYAHLQIPDAVREWIDGVIAGIGQGGAGGGGGLDLTFLLPLLTGAGSLLGLVFGYLILPVWVFYLLKDKTALVATFDRALPQTWRFDTWAIIKTVEHDFGQWVRGQLILGFAVGFFTFIGLIVLSYTRRPDLRALRAPVVDHRGRPGAGPDHRPDHLGDPRGPAGSDRGTRRDRGRAPPLPPRPAGREQLLRAQDPGRRDPAPPGRGHLRDHHRRRAGGAAGGDPCPARDRGLPRRRALPLPAALPGRAARPWPHRSQTIGMGPADASSDG